MKTCNNLKQTVLFFAVQNREHGEELTRMLILEYHADPHHEDERNQTALFYLAKTGGTRCFEFLETCEVDINHRDHNDQTCLFFAAAQNQADMSRALCRAGAKVDLRDNQGMSAVLSTWTAIIQGKVWPSSSCQA